MERRRFVVIGLGSFGHHLSRSLYERGHDVLAVDRRARAVEEIQPYCSRAQVADAADRDELEAAGANNAEVGVVCLGSKIDVSILATMFLKELGLREIVAKAVSRDHARILQRVGATEVVHPERDTAVALARRLAEPDVLEEIPFLEGYALVEIRAPRALWGKTLAETHLRRAHRLSVVMLRREEGRGGAVAAQPDQRIEPGDVLVVLARMDDVAAFRKNHPE